MRNTVSNAGETSTFSLSGQLARNPAGHSSYGEVTTPFVSKTYPRYGAQGSANVATRPNLSESDLRTSIQARENEEENENVIPAAVVVPPMASIAIPTVKLLNQWRGTIVHVDEERSMFVANLEDRLGDDEECQGDFYFDELLATDRPRIRPGAKFYYSIFFEDDSVSRKTQSTILLQSLPGLEKKQIEEAQKRATEREKMFNDLIAKDAPASR